VYRQSLLKWAFEGKLTNKKVKDGELPKGWKKVKIEEIATVGTGATPLKGNNKYYENGKIAWVTSGALNDEFVKDATDYVTDLALKETNLSVYPKHTLLLAMYGEGKTRGKCSELLIEASTNQAIAAIHFKNHDKRVRPFLKYFLLKNYNDIRRLSSGGVQPNLNLGIVKKTVVPLPTIEEQQLIVDELETKLTVCDKIEETISQSLQQSETLRQSILKKAFEGKLI
jgi:type I restriction enzyme S subunit